MLTFYKPKFSEDMKQIIFAQFGVQHNKNGTEEWMKRIKTTFLLPHGPIHVDRGVHEDYGCVDEMFFAYWDHPDTYRKWTAHEEVQNWWGGKGLDSKGSVGFWHEVLTIRTDHFETVYAEDGGGHGVTNFVPLQTTDQHGYWGAMRDRMAASGSSGFGTSDQVRLDSPRIRHTEGRRVKIIVPDQITYIKTVQEWSRCDDEERQIYLEKIGPVLKEGADFLRNEPEESGCASARYTRESTPDGTPIEKTCVIGYFLTLKHLEDWSKSHPTHLAIYRSFWEVAKRLDYNIKIILWHEVSVLRSQDVDAEYFNCHPNTGLLRYFESLELAGG